MHLASPNALCPSAREREGHNRTTRFGGSLAATAGRRARSLRAAILVQVLVAQAGFLAGVGAVVAVTVVGAVGGEGKRGAGDQHDSGGHQNLFHVSTL